ncbi:MAG: tetratricopeptide repeat protein [Flavobacteriales bacterium]
MKKNLILLTLALATATAGMAQKKNVTSAIMLAKKGKYVKAKPYIDKAIKNEKTKGEAKTWNWKAQIYAGIMGSKKKEAVVLRGKEDIAGQVITAMQTTKKLDKDGEFKRELLRIAGPMYNNSLNGGIDAYNAKDYKKAFSMFTNSQTYASILGIVDSVGAYNAGMSAGLIDDHESAAVNYAKCIKYGYGGADVYLKLIDTYKKLGEKEEAISLIQDAKTKFPNDPAIVLNEVQQYIDNKELDKARTSLEAATKSNPENFELQYYSGNIYFNLEMYDEAVVSFKNALKIKPDVLNVKQDMCVAHFNKVVLMSKAMDAIDLNATAEYKKAKDERNAYIKENLPFIEATYKEKETASLKRILNNLYSLTGQNDKRIK